MVIIASLSDHSDQVSFLLPISARIICTFATKNYQTCIQPVKLVAACQPILLWITNHYKRS